MSFCKFLDILTQLETYTEHLRRIERMHISNHISTASNWKQLLYILLLGVAQYHRYSAVFFLYDTYRDFFNIYLNVSQMYVPGFE